MTLRHPATLLLLALCCASSAWAQTDRDPRSSVERNVGGGDRVSVTTTDGRKESGRFVESRTEGLIMEVGRDRRQAAFSWSEIEQVRRRKNGLILGAIIGAVAGGVAAWPLYQLGMNETGEGTSAAVGMVVLGLGAGVGIDALLGSSKTVYRRRAVTASIHGRPERGGGAVRLRVAW